MEYKKRCTNCGRYPFCEKIENPATENNCEKWIRRNYEEVKRIEVENGKM